MAGEFDPRLQGTYTSNLKEARQARLYRNLAMAGTIGSAMVGLYGLTEGHPILALAGTAGLVGRGIHAYIYNRDAQAYDQQADDIVAATIDDYEQDFPRSDEPPTP